ncbi:MAG: Na+:solute symporter [Calditrichaeota bacterium]|nr:Na+:solute symporter [Calditrichota bacterium]MCB0286148.1 Na+:solute symporter [Calditrichota bacterium]MCB9069493.1 Na+:solute symporter [Calditrichia bacterium]
MQVSFLDWTFVAIYFVLALGIGLYFSRKAGGDIVEYFTSGRSLPWWLAGTSMVATTFAADTPLAVTELVANHGIAGNWLWWNMLMSGLLTVFLFARLWRRAEVLTDVEFTEIRYSGKPAAILRGFRALYLAIPINLIILGWVTLAMVKIIELSIGVDKWVAVGICVLVTLLYSGLSGLWGVVVTDFLQFIIAMVGSIALAFFAVDAVGGIEGLKTGLIAQYGADHQILNFTPEIGSVWMPLTAFFVYLAVNWWAAWYPGAEPGGGGYIAQRMFATKNERHSLLATLWFNIAHYALRPWPWVLVALTSLVLFPTVEDKQTGYILVMLNYLPTGFKGLMLASFAAAFMSTVSTQLNWGSSYLINDFYKRFVKTDASEKHYVMAARVSTVFLVIAGALVTSQMETIAGAWKFLLAIGAGTGSVYILRWFWWRINAWSEISAMLASLVVSIVLQSVLGMDTNDAHGFAMVMLITVGISTVTWLTVTFLTAPETDETLIKFYRKTRPGGSMWKPIAAKAPDVKADTGLSRDLLDWLAGIIMIYAALFGFGKFLLGETLIGLGLLLVAVLGFAFIMWDLNARNWEALK